MTQAASNKRKDESTMSRLAKAGVHAPHEMLLWMPRRHLDYTRVVPSERWGLHIGEKVCVDLAILKAPRKDGSHTRFIVDAKEGNSIHRMMVFGALRWSPWKNVNVGDTVRVYAKITEFNGVPQLSSPELVEYRHWGKVVPVYRGISGRVSADSVAGAVHEAIAAPYSFNDAILSIRQGFDGMPEEEIMRRVGTDGTLEAVLRAIHTPVTSAEATWGIKTARRIAVAHVQYQAEKSAARPFRASSVIRVDDALVNGLVRALPFQLTTGKNSQESAIRAIFHSLAEPYPMDVLLSADVGVGKTVLYMVPAVAAQALGKKVGILIPNSLLVEQVSNEFAQIYPYVPVVAVTEGTKAKDIDWDMNPILVGTTGVFAIAKAAGWIPDFLVTDEQQKTSLKQRDQLRGPNTNFLECTATALPRTVALITHGGKELLQVGVRHAKQTIHTQVVDASHKQGMMGKVKEVVAAGGQVALIYPRVFGKEEGDKHSVEEAGANWERIYPGQVAILHGKMSSDEKKRVMASVKSGEKRILIASSIIEIGVTISDLKLLIVIHAERYGVSTLHQMRGRLVRHGGEGWCFLYAPDEVDEETMERLQLLEKTNDGFRLAEMDMELRGFGDLSSESEDQSGASFTLFRDLRLMPGDFRETPGSVA